MIRIVKFSFLITLLSSIAIAQEGEEILEKWYTEEKKGIVEIYKCGDAFCGKISLIKKSNADGSALKDVNNPDPDKQQRHIVGIDILRNLEYSGNEEYEDGEIYDPESGKTYSCELKMVNKDQLEVRGYLGISLIGRTTIWNRVK